MDLFDLRFGGGGRTAEPRTAAGKPGNRPPNRNRSFSLVMIWLQHLNQYITATNMAAISKPYKTASSVTGLPLGEKEGRRPVIGKTADW